MPVECEVLQVGEPSLRRKGPLLQFRAWVTQLPSLSDLSFQENPFTFPECSALFQTGVFLQ